MTKPLTIAMLMCALLAPTTHGADEARADGEPKGRSALRAAPGSDLVEITIRLPDGRVIKRKERRIASRVDAGSVGSESGGGDGSSPAGSRRGAASVSGRVRTVGVRVTGGSNAGGAIGGGGGSGGSSSTSSSSSGGGGGGGGGHHRGQHDGGSDHGSGDSGGDEIVPLAPDTDFRVRVYSWDETGISFQFVQRAIVADPRSKTPERLASLVADQHRASGNEKLVLRFWKEFDPGERHPFDLSDPRELIESGGYTQGLASYWRAFAEALAGEGLTPDYLIFDQEEGVGFWHIPEDERRVFFRELLDGGRAALSVLPPSMTRLSVDEFMDYRDPGTREAFNDYDQFAKDFRASFLRRVFYEPFGEVYGEAIPTSNYGDQMLGFPLLTMHNRPMKSSWVGGISAPVAYTDRRDGAPRYARLVKDHRWNRLIDQLNEVRSTAHVGLTTPWIAPPGYGRYGPDTWARPGDLDAEFALWEVQMDHMLAMGVDTYILWNPTTRFNPSAARADAMMDGWLRHHRHVSTAQLMNLPEIPLDADAIETNGVVTTYEQYLEMMGLDG